MSRVFLMTVASIYLFAACDSGQLGPQDEDDRDQSLPDEDGPADVVGPETGDDDDSDSTDDDGDDGDDDGVNDVTLFDTCGDGLDNDGDGEIDEGCPCFGDETQPCYAGRLEAAGVGICAYGLQTCESGSEFGQWAECSGSVLPGDELCDGLDNDCDGSIDEGCDCVDGEERPCYGGPAGTEGVGLCLGGTQICLDGAWGDCLEDVLPGEEVCDGLDNDCDGIIDGMSSACYTGPAGTEGVGLCSGGTSVCEAGTWSGCVGQIVPVEEVCDGLDNDCDGLVDGFSSACYTGPAGTEGVGICRGGTMFCPAGAWGGCEGEVLPAAEVCDGIDNDCDGVVDEGCSCTIGTSESCFLRPDGSAGPGVPGLGICREGTRSCEALPGGGSDWTTCWGAVFAETEICDNGIDDDCDGNVDEGCIVDCSVSDVVLLIDVTGSMGGAISSVQTMLTGTIIPGLSAAIPDLEIGVGSFRDFPVSPYGSGSDRPFTVNQTMTTSAASAQLAVNSLYASGGADMPESHIEALYQVATGEGFGSWVSPASCPAGRSGAMCFRSGATPIIILISDVPMHNGPSGYGYSGVWPTPHTYSQTIARLTAMGAHVLGINVGSAYSDMAQVATDTGSVDGAGSPIVFNVAGSGTGTAVVDAVSSLCL